MGGVNCRAVCATGCDFVVSALLEYNTAKIVHIHNKKVGALNRLVQLAIVVYIVGCVTTRQ